MILHVYKTIRFRIQFILASWPLLPFTIRARELSSPRIDAIMLPTFQSKQIWLVFLCYMSIILGTATIRREDSKYNQGFFRMKQGSMQNYCFQIYV